LTFIAAFAIAAVLLVSAILTAGEDQSNSKESGQTAFKANCIVCHGEDGAGSRLGKSLQVPDLRSQEVQKKSDAELAQTISEGKGHMPSFKRVLDPEQVPAVVGYVRELGKSKP
jgi:alcohol dehydrogenase (cytochrome c)/quinohemoprotein ethanol dehydrogenase